MAVLSVILSQVLSAFQIFASIIKSVRDCEPGVAWRSNRLPTRQPDFAGDC